MIARALSVAAAPRARVTILLAAFAVAAALALVPGPLAPAAARGALAVAAIGAAAVLARGRRTAPALAAAARLVVTTRAPLGKESGVAVVEVAGRTLLVGFGAGGVSLVAELSTRAPDGSAP